MHGTSVMGRRLSLSAQSPPPPLPPPPQLSTLPDEALITATRARVIHYGPHIICSESDYTMLIFRFVFVIDTVGLAQPTRWIINRKSFLPILNDRTKIKLITHFLTLSLSISLHHHSVSTHSHQIMHSLTLTECHQLTHIIQSLTHIIHSHSLIHSHSFIRKVLKGISSKPYTDTKNSVTTTLITPILQQPNRDSSNYNNSKNNNFQVTNE